VAIKQEVKQQPNIMFGFFYSLKMPGQARKFFCYCWRK